jgi:hypothetical protein
MSVWIICDLWDNTQQYSKYVLEDYKDTIRRNEKVCFIYQVYYREIISLRDENTANARWEPAGTVPVMRQRR